jgi:hypothetical protein
MTIQGPAALVPWRLLLEPSSGDLQAPELATAQRTAYPTRAVESSEPRLGYAALNAAFGPIAAAHLADPGIDPLDRYTMALSSATPQKLTHAKRINASCQLGSTRDSPISWFQRPRLEDPNRSANRCYLLVANSQKPRPVLSGGGVDIRYDTDLTFASVYTNPPCDFSPEDANNAILSGICCTAHH